MRSTACLTPPIVSASRSRPAAQLFDLTVKYPPPACQVAEDTRPQLVCFGEHRPALGSRLLDERLRLDMGGVYPGRGFVLGALSCFCGRGLGLRGALGCMLLGPCLQLPGLLLCFGDHAIGVGLHRA